MDTARAVDGREKKEMVAIGYRERVSSLFLVSIVVMGGPRWMMGIEKGRRNEAGAKGPEQTSCKRRNSPVLEDVFALNDSGSWVGTMLAGLLGFEANGGGGGGDDDDNDNEDEKEGEKYAG